MEYSRHVYDIELFEIFNSLRSKFVNANQVKITPELSNSAFIDLQESQVYKTLANEGVDIKKLKEEGLFIVLSISAAFLPLMSWRILTIDPYKIEALLDYQSTIYSGNYLDINENFIGFLEFIIYPFVKANNYLNEEIRLSKIMNWLSEHRIFIRVPEQKGLKSNLNKTQLELLHEQLLGTFISKDTPLNSFLAAFSEKPLPHLFNAITWQKGVGKNALSELLELTTNYRNKDGEKFLPKDIKDKIVPALFIDAYGNKIFLNKKPGSHSKYITDIEKYVSNCQKTTSEK
jgi:hypothetical protein